MLDRGAEEIEVFGSRTLEDLQAVDPRMTGNVLLQPAVETLQTTDKLLLGFQSQN